MRRLSVVLLLVLAYAPTSLAQDEKSLLNVSASTLLIQDESAFQSVAAVLSLCRIRQEVASDRCTSQCGSAGVKSFTGSVCGSGGTCTCGINEDSEPPQQ